MEQRFPLAIRLLHWTMAALILAMLFVGVGMVSTAGPAYVALLALHRPLGIAVLVLALCRLVIRLATRTPPLPADLVPAQVVAAKAVHVLLYLAMIGMPLIGWAMLSAGGYPVHMAGGVNLPPLFGVNRVLFGLLRLLHTLGGLAFFALILGHLTIALIHGFIRRDSVLRSMLFGKGRT